ncbi:MAG TPA: hypothetical protein VEL51_17665 [Vicinamibacterales bacterium]|nr:hypothetical protein [Vicinamibacterales bacterium]
MKRWFTTLAVVLCCSAALRADITIVQTTTVEGGMAAMAANAGANMSPKMTTRVKGMKNRTDMDAGPISFSAIVDLATKQMIVLRADQKTATIVSAPSAPTTTTSATGATTTTPPITGPSIEATVKPTGKSQVIDGLKCEEYSFTTTMDMSAMSGGRQMPPEAAAMMQGMKIIMAGSMWVTKDAPGAAEYLAFQKAMAAGDLAGAAAGMTMNIPGMDKMMKALSSLNGLAYLSEMTMNVEGEGQMADMMRQMGPMKITTKVNSVTTDALSDDLFKVPEGYTIVKQ